MERVAVDVLGTLPETERGNKYILIAMDSFSKKPAEAYAFPNQEAVTGSDILVSQEDRTKGHPRNAFAARDPMIMGLCYLRRRKRPKQYPPLPPPQIQRQKFPGQ